MVTCCRELLEKIKDFEDCQFSGAKSNTDFSVFASKLEPMNDAGASALLNSVSVVLFCKCCFILEVLICYCYEIQGTSLNFASDDDVVYSLFGNDITYPSVECAVKN